MGGKSGESDKQVHRLKKYYIFNISAFFLALIACTSVYAWECDVILESPNVIKIGQVITFSASGTPEGGSYSWYNTHNLVPDGSTASLTGYQPSHSQYILVGITYTTPRGKKCTTSKWLWVCTCYVNISGPAEASVGDPIALSAQGDPSSGTYAWTPLPGLIADGSTAEFTGWNPGKVAIDVAYTPPDADEPCYDTHTITVKEDCNVSITGPAVVGAGNAIELSASGVPPGGTYYWTEQTGLIPGTSGATFFGESPGIATIQVQYLPPGGGTSCSATHDVTVFGVESITGPSCVNSGRTLAKGDFTIVTSPPGFEDFVIVSPLSFSTSSQSAEVTVTAYSGAGAGSDEATMAITVVNSDVKTTTGIAFEIPNYVKKPLEIIGLGDKTDLSVGTKFKNFKECCSFGVAPSMNGSLDVILSVNAGPFTIVGIPVPPKIKEYVSADALNVSLSAGSDAKMSGNYNSCDNKSEWTGGGDLTAEVKVGGEITGKFPEVIILKAEIKGSTSILEKFSIEDLTKLKITTDWKGLTAEVSSTIKIPSLNIVGNFTVSKTYFQQNNLSPVTIDLPF